VEKLGISHVKRVGHVSCSIVGRGGALVDSMPFVRRIAGLNPAIAAMYGPWESPSLAVACGASA